MAKRRRKGGSSKALMTPDQWAELTGFLMITLSVIVLAALVLNYGIVIGVESSEQGRGGVVGHDIASFFGRWFGVGSFFLPLLFGVWGVQIFRRHHIKALIFKALGIAVLLLSFCALLGRFFDGSDRLLPGGTIGMGLADVLDEKFGVISYVVLGFFILVGLVMTTPISFTALFEALLKLGRFFMERLQAGLSEFSEWRAELAERRRERRLQRKEETALRRARRAENEDEEEYEEEDEEEESEEEGEEEDEETHGRRRWRAFQETEAPLIVRRKTAQAEDEEEEEGEYEEDDEEEYEEDSEEEGEEEDDEEEDGEEGMTTEVISSEERGRAAKKRRAKKAEIEDEDAIDDENFELPSVDLLNDPPPSEGMTEEDLQMNAKILQETLKDFNVECRVVQVIPGPTVTRYELAPAPGVKVSAFVSLSDDIALAMAAPSIRIEAPIPGKAAVGIEIPNRSMETVVVKEILKSDVFKKTAAKTPLPLALGKDVAGEPMVANLKRMPHLLVAGTTGSGKSVCLNTIVMSILYTIPPQDVKFIMIDPKMVELQVYNGIPHLLAPVVTDSRKAPLALGWAVREMESRYRCLSRSGVRDIDSYNQKMAKEPPQMEMEFEEGEESEEAQAKRARSKKDELPRHLPYIIVIVDELADLMLVAPNECEDAIARLAQMARAVGIHLVLATQRPSVDVITGVIKANLPTRIAFQVSSKTDSRTILDQNGADKLVGRGDMLYLPGDRAKPYRIQGCFVSDEEIQRTIDFFHEQGKARYGVDPIKEEERKVSGVELQSIEEDDPLTVAAIQFILEQGQCSVSAIQRRLNVGHPRAGRIVDLLERRGIVGSAQGAKPREVIESMANQYLEDRGYGE